MTRFQSLIFSSVVVFLLSCSQANGHADFKKFLSKKFPEKKVNCNACHVDKKPKTELNVFGKMYTQLMGIDDLSATVKSLKGQEKKDYKKEVMMPAFEKAFEKLHGMSYAEMLEAGLVPGVVDKKAKKTDGE